MSSTPPPTKCFTIEFNRLTPILFTPVKIGEPMVLQLGGPQPAMSEFKAIWDTGATNCVISTRVVSQLSLKPTGMVIAQTANGPCPANTYLVNIYLPMMVYFAGMRVTEGKLEGDADVLIGMDIISKGDFSVTNTEGKTFMSFRVPSIKRIDYVAESRLAAQKQAEQEAQSRDPDFQRKERNKKKRERRHR